MPRLLILRVLAVALLAVLTYGARAVEPSETFKNCVEAKFNVQFPTLNCGDNPDAVRNNFLEYLIKLDECFQEEYGSTDRLTWDGEGISFAVCKYFEKFENKCSPYGSCADLIIAVQNVFRRGLTAADICTILNCSGCTNSGCPETGYPTISCREDENLCGNRPYCISLRDNIAKRLLCYFATHSCPPTTPADIDQIFADTACEVFSSSGCAGTDSNGCLDIIACLLTSYPLAEITAQRIKLIADCSGCSDICNWTCPSGSCNLFRFTSLNNSNQCHLRCDTPVDFCEDLKLTILIAEACAAKNNCLILTPSPHLAPECYARIIADFVNACHPGISCYQVYHCIRGLPVWNWLGDSEYQTIFGSTTNCTLAPTCEWADLDRADGKNFADLDIAIWIAMKHGGPPTTWEAFVVGWLGLSGSGGFCLSGECKDIQPHLQASLGEEIGFPILPAAFEARGCKMDGVSFIGDGDPEDQDNGNDCGGTGTPKSPNPVAMAYGSKMESSVDISVALPGRPFNVTRSYISREYFGTPSVGQIEQVQPCAVPVAWSRQPRCLWRSSRSFLPADLGPEELPQPALYRERPGT